MAISLSSHGTTESTALNSVFVAALKQQRVEPAVVVVGDEMASPPVGSGGGLGCSLLA